MKTEEQTWPRETGTQWFRVLKQKVTPNRDGKYWLSTILSWEEGASTEGLGSPDWLIDIAV